MSVPADRLTPLARFPVEVQDAYRKFLATGHEEAAHTVVRAALLDFLPRHKSELRNGSLRSDARLMEDLGYDSLAIAELVFFFEDLFKVTISTQEIRKVGTVGELHAFVTRKIAASPQLA